MVAFRVFMGDGGGSDGVFGDIFPYIYYILFIMCLWVCKTCFMLTMITII